MYIKRKKKSEQEKLHDQIESARMWFFWSLIWAQLKDKNCWECGVYLGKEMKSYMFDHLLEQNKYEELKYEKENIFICCGDCHTKKTNGFPGEKHRQAIDNAKIRFNVS